MIAYGRVGVGNIDALTMMDKGDQREALKLASDVLVWNENRMSKLLSDSNLKFQHNTDGDEADLTQLLKLTKD